MCIQVYYQNKLLYHSLNVGGLGPAIASTVLSSVVNRITRLWIIKNKTETNTYAILIFNTQNNSIASLQSR